MIRKNEARYGYKTKASVLEYENPYMRIYKNVMRLPSGKENIHWTAQRENFSIIIPLFDDQTTILVGQYRLAVDRFSWEFPMGMIKGLEPLEVAKQELQEEAGYEAHTWETIGHFYPANGWYENSATIFVAKEVSFVGKQQEETEFLETKKCVIRDISHMISDSTIQDGPTIVAFHYLEMYLGKQR